MSVFIVGSRDGELGQEDFAIIRAISKEDASNVYASEIGGQDEAFLEFVYEKTVNMSFASARSQ